jgi:hypothetical protein
MIDFNDTPLQVFLVILMTIIDFREPAPVSGRWSRQTGFIIS